MSFITDIFEGAPVPPASVPYPFSDSPAITPGTNVQIVAQRSNQRVEPEGFHFRFEMTGFSRNMVIDPTDHDPAFTGVDVFIDYGEGVDTDFTAPDYAVSGIARCQRYSRGPLGGVAFPAGNHIVQVWLYLREFAEWGYGIFHIGGSNADTPAVRPQSEIISAGTAVYVHPTGDNTNRPQGVTQTFQTIDAAWAATLGQPGFQLIYVARDQVFETDGLSLRSGAPAYLGTMIHSAPGNGARGKVLMGAGAQGQLVFDQGTRDSPGVPRDFIFAEADAEGLFDPTDETGRPTPFIASATYGSQFLAIIRSKIRGFASALSFQSDLQRETIVIYDSDLGDWQNICILGGVAIPTVVRGCRIKQHVGARSGGPRFNAQYIDHGPFRFSQTDLLLITQCDLFNNAGWVPNFNLQTAQPADRTNTAGTPGARSVTTDNVMEGGSTVGNFGWSGGLAALIGAQNAVFDFNVLIGNFMTRGGILTTMGGLSARCNLVVFPDSERDVSIATDRPSPDLAFAIQAPFIVGSMGGTPENFAAPILFEFNTVVNLTTPAKMPVGSEITQLLSADPAFTNVLEENTLLFQPGQANPGNEPMTQLDRVMTPLYNHLDRQFDQNLEITLPSDMGFGDEIVIPYPSGRSAADYRRIGFISVGILPARSDFADVFEAGGIRITHQHQRLNASTQQMEDIVWTSGSKLSVRPELATVRRYYEFATPDTAGFHYAPGTGSAAENGATRQFDGATDILWQRPTAAPSHLGAIQA